MADFVKLFDQFKRHRKFVNNYSDNTLIACSAAWRLYRRLVGDDITKQSLQEFVVRMREAGKTPPGPDQQLIPPTHSLIHQGG